MIQTGKILQQRHRIQKQIGQGGMGAVYVATDDRFNSTVAIKETLVTDEHFRRAFEREARLLNSLKHPALPRVSDHFDEDNGQFLVMEYIPGEDLSSTLEREETPFTYEKVLDWADQLLDALEFLHLQSSPVVHRDIKPQNLKVTPKGQIVLLDFGLAKGNPTDAGHQTAAKSIFGYSRNYASLEQIQGTGTDPRSDLYSLAATLYHLLTNHAPEDALTRAMAVLAGRPDPLVPANAIEPSIPAGLAGILQKCLDLNADGRPSTAAEMRQMFREYENYADLAKPNDARAEAAALAGGGVALEHATKLMPGATRHRADDQTNIKTQLLPTTGGNDSILTAVRPPKTTGGGKRSVARTAGFAVAGLLAACVVGLGAYRLGPEIFGTETTAEQPQASVPAALPSNAAAEPTVTAADVGTDPSVETVDAPPPAVNAAPAPRTRSDASRNSKTVAAANRRAASDANGEDPMVDPDIPRGTIYAGNVVIKNGRVFMPDGRVYDQNGIRTRRATPGTPPEPPFYRYMKPRDLEQLRELQRRGIVVNPQVPVIPKPTASPKQ